MFDDQENFSPVVVGGDLKGLLSKAWTMAKPFIKEKATEVLKSDLPKQAIQAATEAITTKVEEKIAKKRGPNQKRQLAMKQASDTISTQAGNAISANADALLKKLLGEGIKYSNKGYRKYKKRDDDLEDIINGTGKIEGAGLAVIEKN